MLKEDPEKRIDSQRLYALLFFKKMNYKTE